MRHLFRNRLDGPQTTASGSPPSGRWTVETVGEAILLSLVASFFLYLYVDSRGWRPADAYLPRITIAVGSFFIVLRIIAIARLKPAPRGAIMDTGFGPVGDRGEAVGRFTRIAAFTGLLYLGIWLFGIHIALPAALFAYVTLYGEVRKYWAVILAIAFELLLVAIDQALYIRWPTPLLVGFH